MNRDRVYIWAELGQIFLMSPKNVFSGASLGWSVLLGAWKQPVAIVPGIRRP
jgi:hypothetical protein